MQRMKMRFLIIPFLVMLGMGLFALPAFAEGEVYAIQVGTVYYEANADGTQKSDQVVEKDTITHLFADASVTQVGRKDEIFSGCTSLQVVDLSGATSLVTIYSEAFRDCVNLHTVLLPSNLQEIQSGAFRGCTALTTIDLSHTAIAEIETYLFYGCSKLTTVSFPAALSEIDYYAFCYCTAFPLGDALENTSLKTIANHAFYGCTAITSAVLPDSVTSLGVNAFAQCSNFAILTLGETPPTAYASTFTGCAQTNLLGIDSSAIATYKAVSDGDTTDLYWYGWLLEKYDVTSKLSLSVANWEYCENGAPSPVLQKDSTTIASDVTYLYATAEDGTYQSIDNLPHSTAGEIAAGTYWCKAVYDAQSEDGTAFASFTVTQKEIEATIWVIGIKKEYDGTTDITGELQPTVKMVGGLTNDIVSATGDFYYQDAEVGDSKTIVAENLVLTGDDKENYYLKATVASEVGEEITKATITIPAPTASAIDYGETLEQSILTPSDLPIAGYWVWSDDTTQPSSSGYFPAIFIPNDTDNYEIYGPVDVYVVVNGGISANDGSTSGTSSDFTVSTSDASVSTSTVFDTPETGDSTHTARYILLMVLACFGIAASIVCIVWGKREEREEAQPYVATLARTRYVSKH